MMYYGKYYVRMLVDFIFLNVNVLFYSIKNLMEQRYTQSHTCIYVDM